MSVVFERSNKGFGAERTLFATEIHCGFFTVLITRDPIIEKIVKMLKLYRLMKSGGEGAREEIEAEQRLLENAARGVLPVQRPNPLHRPSVPSHSGIHKRASGREGSSK